MLKYVGDGYHAMYRGLRTLYKWSPIIVDQIEVKRLVRIYNEAIEDNKEDGDREDH